jgi:hypothetical protein
MRLPSLLRRPLFVLSPLTVPLAVFAATGCVAPADVVSADDPPVAGDSPDGGSWSGPGAPTSRTPVPDAPPAGPARPSRPTAPPAAGPVPPPKPTTQPPPPPPPPPLPLPSGELPLRDTAWRGNATGEHDCGEFEYHHYEEQGSAGGPQLHVVGVRSHLAGVPVRVEVARAGASTLVLSSHQGGTRWHVTAAPGATIERVILVGPGPEFGDLPQSAAVPAGVPVQSYVAGGVTEGAEWPSVYTADLVAAAENVAGRSLTSFRGCNGAARFRIDEPGEVRPPRPTSTAVEPTLPTNCGHLTQESGYCVSLAASHGSSTRLIAIGADSGEVCGGPAVDAPFDGTMTSSLGWAGDYVYSCAPERGLMRVSVLDGSVDIAPIACEMVTGYQGGLLSGLGYTPGALELFGKLVRFESFADAARRRLQSVLGDSVGSELFASRVATRGDRALFAWHSTSALDVGDPNDLSGLTTLPLEGFDNWVEAFDEVDEGRLFVGSGFFGGAPELLIFEPQTGAFRGTLPLSGGLGFNEYVHGLDCFTRE